MKNKFQIVALKVLMLWPIGALIAMLLSGFKIDLIWIVGGGLVLSVGFVFWNVFEYDKYDSMGSEDYLESCHSIKLPNTESVLEMIDSQSKGAFSDVVLTKKIDEQEYWLFDLKTAHGNSVLRVDFSTEDIVVTIKPKYLKFLPDFARNYRSVNRLKRAAANLHTTIG